ncbi:DUF2946 family protein [Maricaulis salignorans]|uniref:DUF2946 family protein n=1 Tax=Maricaulis salignorans TaxID=144026 RepID=UPI003A94D18D
MLTMLRQGRTLWAQGILALALLAAGIQASLPQGFMLDRDGASGAISVVFCTGHGAEQRWIDLATGETRTGSDLPRDDAGTGQPCAFASASAAIGALPQTPSILVPPLPLTRVAEPADTIAPAAYRRPGPPVRAPPARL